MMYLYAWFDFIVKPTLLPDYSASLFTYTFFCLYFVLFHISNVICACRRVLQMLWAELGEMKGQGRGGMCWLDVLVFGCVR